MAEQTDKNPPIVDALGFPVRLLLVDDSSTNRMLAQSILNRMGYEVDAVGSGKEAIEAVSQADYAAVLMDVWMPKMDGLMATGAIRALPGAERNIPIIAMTAEDDDEGRQRCLAAGMDDYVLKPIDRSFLAAALARATGQADDSGAPSDEASEVVSHIRVGLIDEVMFAQMCDGAKHEKVMEILVLFKDETDEHVGRMAAAVDTGDLVAVSRSAHVLKGAAGQCGARRLEAMAVSIRRAAKTKNQNVTERLVAAIGDVVAETWKVFADRGYRLPTN